MAKIIGNTVGTTISPKKLSEKLNPVKTVNGKSPDANGNVEVIGNDGKTPYIQDGYWYINGVNTNVQARGENGHTPYIQNGYWYINGSSIGVKAQGENGVTPIKGVDYYTEEEKAEWEAFIADELAKRGQLKPEFANSVEECTDTSKLYVLPDGYIYAYVTTTETRPAYNNLLSTATDATGAVLNGVGYLEKKRWGSSATTFGDYKDGDTTLVGMIPFTLGQTLRIKGIEVSGASAMTYTAFRGFDASRKNLVGGYANLGGYADLMAAVTLDAANNMLTLHPTSNISGGLTGQMCYIAFTVFPTNGSENIIVTVNAEITDEVITETKSEWTNTGRAFVPADYEDRIVGLEADVSKLKNQSETLETDVSELKNQIETLETDVSELKNQSETLPESNAGESVPTYVLAEATKVANKVLSVRNAHSFVFGAISDIHSDGRDVSTLHAGQGMYEIDKFTTLDACLNFGDGIDARNFENIYADSFLHIRKCLHDVARTMPYIQMQGNHDQYKEDTTEKAQQKYFAYIGANNVGTVTDWDNRFRNYGYRDFPDQRMRVIYLNSVDVSEGENIQDCWLSAMQLSWLVNTALDFTDKNGWSFVVGCHHPLNWWYMDNLLAILNAYKGKASGSVTVSGTTVNYNFANATAEFIAHFHGHLHNFRVETFEPNKVLSITIPNACNNGRDNEYGTNYPNDPYYAEDYGDADENGDQRVFSKTANTAEDTAFNVVVVDRLYRKIHCINYGAGIDREIDFNGNVVVPDEPDEPIIPDVPDDSANLFKKDDPEILDGYRKNSSNQLVYYAENQLVTGWIEGKVGDTFTITTDKPNNANSYTGVLLCYDENKKYVADISHGMTANNTAVPSADYLTITFTIPESYKINSSSTNYYTGTTWVRFCLAYYDKDNIVIAKAS